MADDHVNAVSRVYGPEAWEVYDLLDQSLDPRVPDAMLELATERLTPSSAVLDVGCRDAAYLIELVRVSGARGVGIDPVSRLAEQARKAVAEAGLTSRIEIAEGVMQSLPYPDASFDLVWCRDVMEIVEGLESGIVEMARVIRAGGHLVAFTVFATDLLEPKEAAMLARQNLALVAANLVEKDVEAAFGRAGLEVVVKDEIGTEWREYVEERSQSVSRDLLRLARLRRQRDRIVAEAGEEIYGHIESNLHWSAYQFLGKLLPVVYVLRKT
ncbi:MAG TPA: class I SAM-dependent methyltransferase [Gaiellaceae bacterium]|jgi:ubiquinone/menaquinone biosynthesis C-methylase UbiE|nr:class I SAM-dependent methyltransferase [Gaiellaceae bacterium]